MRSGSGGRRAKLNLDLFCSPLANQQVFLALDVIGNCLVHRVASHAERMAVDDTRKRNHADVGRPASDVDDHAPARLRNRQARANRGRHSLFHQVHLARPRAVGTVPDGTPFHLGDSRGNADYHARTDEAALPVSLLYEVIEHFLGGVEIGNHAVSHRLDGRDAPGRAANHCFRFAADRLDTSVHGVQGHNRWLIQDNAVAAGEDARVGRTEVDGKIVRKHGKRAEQH